MNLRCILTEAQRDGKVVSIHWGPYGEGYCALGYVHSIGADHVILKSAYSDGVDAGYELRYFSDIHGVDVDGQFERKVDFLIRHRDAVFKERFLPESMEAAASLNDAIAALAMMDVVVEIRTKAESDPRYGFVEDADSDGVLLRIINNYGTQDGTAYLSFEGIECIDINTHKCQVLHYLHKNYTV